MKTILTISLILNLGFAGYLFLILSDRPENDAKPAAVVEVDNTPASIRPITSTVPVIEPGPIESSTDLDQVVTVEVPIAFRTRKRLREPKVIRPLVFRDVNFAALKLNPAQLKEIDELRNYFLDEIGGAAQDPNDPDYGQRWLKAQPEVDDMLQAALGRPLFQELEVLAEEPTNDESALRP